jgi:HK97 family phage portal protein
MGWWQRLLGIEPDEARQSSPASGSFGSVESAVLASLEGARSTSAGVTVSEESSLRHTAVLACVRILANSVAMLPLPVYKRLSPRGKERAPEHPLYPILHEQANPEMSAFELRRWLMQGVLLWGNGYAEIAWSDAGTVSALWPLRPDRVEVERRNGALVYRCTLPTGSVIWLPQWKVLHLRGLSGNGVTGYSVVRQLINESVGLGLATQEFGSRFFGNGARPGVVLKHPGTLSDKAYANLRAGWAGEHEGLSNAHRVRILEEGMDVVPLSVPPEEAQFLQSRKFQVTEIARAFGVPPHLIGDMERATFSNIEHQYMEFLQFSLGPYLRQIEQVIHASLMTASERRLYFVEHVRDSILQADTMTRYQAHALGRQWGWLSVNDIRALENMNPVAGGDEYLVPLNMTPANSELPLPNAKNAKEAKSAKKSEEKQRTATATDIETPIARHSVQADGGAVNGEAVL